MGGRSYFLVHQTVILGSSYLLLAVLIALLSKMLLEGTYLDTGTEYLMSTSTFVYLIIAGSYS